MGGEFDMGAASLPVMRFNSPSGVTADTSGSVLYVGGGAVVGVAGAEGPVMLRAEAVLGGRSLTAYATTHFTDCVGNSTASATTWLIEPRVGAELFVTPWASVGVTAGVNLVPDVAFMGGAFLQLHSRAFSARHDRTF
jgi:hypothetical protein